MSLKYCSEHVKRANVYIEILNAMSWPQNICMLFEY